jgi:hypothetical protein
MESHEENKKYIENLQEFWISSSSLMDLHSQHAILPNLDDGEQQRWICCKRQDAESTINVHRKHWTIINCLFVDNDRDQFCYNQT